MIKYNKDNKDTFNSIDDMLDKYHENEFNSPMRSTIPLLAFFKQDLKKQQFISSKINEDSDYVFEYATPHRKGKGPASYTDLMIINEDWCIAIEAKWTETKSESDTVEKWLVKRVKKDSKEKWEEKKENREKVLSNWLEMISEKTGIILKKEDVLEFPYQMIHRVASACSLNKEETTVIYLVFDLSLKTKAMQAYYQDTLAKLSAMLNDTIKMQVVGVSVISTKYHEGIKAEWTKNKQIDFSKEVKKGIIDNTLMSFELA